MSALIGALRVSLSAETAQFEAGMKRAQRTANQTRSSFQKAFGGLAGIVKGGLAGLVSGLSVGLIVQAGRAALEYAGSLKEVAQQLGVTTRELQVFRFAAAQNGATVEEADQALSKFAISISKALSGSKQATAAFNAVGVSLADLQNKSKTELIGQLADNMLKAGGASKNAAAGVAIFGRGFNNIVPLLDQGSKGFSELEKAAERLGVVLDDQLIDQADEAADKVDALQTVLKAQIAGAVAQNAGAIVELANSLVYLVSKIGQAITAWNDFKNALDAQAFDIASRNPFLSAAKRKEGAERAAMARGRISDNGIGWNVGGSSVTVSLAPAKKPPRPATGSPPRFLGGGGGGGRKRSDDSARLAEQERRRVFQVSQESLRAEIDILRAKQSLATDYSERYALSIQVLNLEKQGFENELAFRVQEGDLKKTEAERLKLANDQRDAVERHVLIAEEEAQRKEDYNRLDQLDFDLQRDILQSQEQLADTAAEQRAVRLRLLDLDYRQEQARLEAVLADEQASWAAKEEARRRLANLNRTFANDREATIRDTAGPFERAQLQFGDLSEEMENLKVQGIMGAADALTALTDGFGSFKDAAISAIKQVIAEFIRLQTIKFLMNIAGSAFGAPGAGSALGGGSGYVGIGGFMGGTGLPGFATGGGFNIMGNRGVDQNLLSLNGLPIARVSHGERVSISNDNQRSGGNISIPITINGPVSRETAMQLGARVRGAVAAANRKGA